MKRSQAGRPTHLLPGSGTTFRPRPRTTSALWRTTLECPVSKERQVVACCWLFCSRTGVDPYLTLGTVDGATGQSVHAQCCTVNSSENVFMSLLLLQISLLFFYSQVGWCWKVQRVHDPDVLKWIYLPLYPNVNTKMWRDVMFRVPILSISLAHLW